MISKKEVEKKVAEIFSKGNQYNHYNIEVLYDKHDNSVIIMISRMYDYFDVQFDHLAHLSELFGTRTINIGDKSAYPGCETCDFGSSYQVIIRVGNITKEIV